MSDNIVYTSESERDYSKEYSSITESEYSSTKLPLENETSTQDTSYDLAKPRRILIKARLLND